MQGAYDNIHLAIDIATPAVLIAVSWVGLLINGKLGQIKLGQEKSKAELVAHQNELQQDFNAKHAENTQAIAVHTASDDQKFLGINSTLTRIENKLDRINGH